MRGLRRNTRQVLALTCAALLVLCNVVGVVYELGHNPTMVQEAQGRRALATLRADHPRLLPGTTIEFVAPADHIYYVLAMARRYDWPIQVCRYASSLLTF